jgi:hypothetical protein
MIEKNEGCSKLFFGSSMVGFVILGIIITGAAIGAWGIEGLFYGPVILFLIFIAAAFLLG